MRQARYHRVLLKISGESLKGSSESGIDPLAVNYLAQQIGLAHELDVELAVVIGGAVVLLADRFAHYHLSSSLRDYFSYAPNNMLRHAVISGLLRQRWTRLHFGGGRGPDPKDSLFKFKRMFSKQEAQFYIGSFIADEAVYESLRSDWVRANPDKVAAYGNRVLCYRYR